MRSLLKMVAVVALSSAAHAQGVFTGNYDNSRTNANLSEAILNPRNVKSGSFGKLFSLSVDGQIYAQPLYQENVAISGKGAHNVVFVATMHNSVFAFDADVPAIPLWSVNLGPSVPAQNYTSDIGPYSDIVPENGILGTPVIDPATGTLYVVAATLESGSYIYRLHALDTGTGEERFHAPTAIRAQVVGIGDGSIGGSVAFDGSQHIQRPALLLANGVVYVSFGSHGDAVPFHGWILGYSAYDVRNQVSVFNPTPNGGGGAFWQSGRGPAADADGNIYAVSSNGNTDETSNFSDNVLKLNPGNLAVSDWFAPFNVQFLNDNDDDLGACGAILIDGTNDLVTGGKQGIVYLIDRTSFGHTGANDAQILQTLNTGHFGIFNMALWNRADGPLLYVHTANSPVTSYQLQNGRFTPSPVARSVNGFNVPFQGMAISASGGTAGSGVLWVLAPASYPLPSRAVLHAYNAEDLSEIWNSDMVADDAAGNFVKFTNPTVANGRVYVATASNQLVVYGTGGADSSQVPTITGVVNAASYAAGPAAAGEIVAIFGSGLGPAELVSAAFDRNDTIASQLSATQVTFNGVPGPILYTSAGVIAAIVPYEVAGADAIVVQVSFNSQLSSPVTLPGGAAAPGIFTADASGSGPGAILNADYSLNSPDNPAAPGSIVIVYATGGGQTNPPALTGTLTIEATTLASDVRVTAGGQPATVLYAGNAGGEVAGAVQLNVQLPDGVTGTVPILVSIAGAASQATATVSIR